MLLFLLFVELMFMIGIIDAGQELTFAAFLGHLSSERKDSGTDHDAGAHRDRSGQRETIFFVLT